MQTYLDIAKSVIATMMAAAPMHGLSEEGSYLRPSTAQLCFVHVQFEAATHHQDLQIVWLVDDRKAIIQHQELLALGTPPLFQDLLTVGGHVYQVQQSWEEAPGLTWGMQVRPWN